MAYLDSFITERTCCSSLMEVAWACRVISSHLFFRLSVKLGAEEKRVKYCTNTQGVRAQHTLADGSHAYGLVHTGSDSLSLALENHSMGSWQVNGCRRHGGRHPRTSILLLLLALHVAWNTVWWVRFTSNTVWSLRVISNTSCACVSAGRVGRQTSTDGYRV